MNTSARGELVPTGGGDTISLVRDVLTLGRRVSCDICLPFTNISGIHAELKFRDGSWHVRDLHSTNGIKVNNSRVEEKTLYPDDEVTFGKQSYVIHYEMPEDGRAREESREDIMSQSLMEKAGLTRPQRRSPMQRSTSK